MRDLEIRGAGNLLGSEQSGYVTSVGFELYCQPPRQWLSLTSGYNASTTEGLLSLPTMRR